jgi:hypothetical protein
MLARSWNTHRRSGNLNLPTGVSTATGTPTGTSTLTSTGTGTTATGVGGGTETGVGGGGTATGVGGGGTKTGVGGGGTDTGVGGGTNTGVGAEAFDSSTRNNDDETLNENVVFHRAQTRRFTGHDLDRFAT